MSIHLSDVRPHRPASPSGRPAVVAALGATTSLTASLAATLLLALAALTPRVASGQGTARRPGDARASSADSLVELAMMRARAGDTTLALKTLERATKIAPDYAPAFYQRGLLL